MRLWSLHPKYLDSNGLVALWREGLLAQSVLKGRTLGYTHHPQLERFGKHSHPIAAINAYLHFVCDEAKRRGYEFDRSKIGRKMRVSTVPITTGQLRHELDHLKKKLFKRDRRAYEAIRLVKIPKPHPLFKTVRGGIETWERIRRVRPIRKTL